MGLLNLRHIGSYQKGIFFRSENSLEEAWARIGRTATEEYSRSGMIANSASREDWEALRPYGVVRLQQAVEFRRVAAAGSSLTAPLPLYYALLNLTRGIFALEEEKKPARYHGLSFGPAATLLDCAAVTTGSGTFIDLLAASKNELPTGSRLSMSDCLCHIPEIAEDYGSPQRGFSRATPVMVKGWHSGAVQLEFLNCPVEGFRANWTRDYPYLAEHCDLLEEGASLQLRHPVAQEGSYESVAAFCERTFLVDLLVRENAVWYAPIRVNAVDSLPRPAYYLAALYILASVVRYEPEALLPLMNSDSELGWFLRRFINAAERFYPQLMLSWLHKQTVFFATA